MRRSGIGLRVVLAGGGSGGHLVPGLELARALLAAGHSVQLLRPGRAVETAVLEGCPGLAQRTIPLQGGKWALPLALARASLAARRALRDFEAELVVGLGGRGALPAVLAARSLGIPSALLEQNLVPGRANRLLARIVQRSYVAFEETRGAWPRPARPRSLVTGMPLRPEIVRPRARSECDGLARDFALPSPAARTLLVAGGSQGAQALNEGVPRLFANLPPDVRAGWRVVHLSGPGREDEARRAWQDAGVPATVLGYSTRMGDLIALADLVVCRGGAMTLLELAAAGKPSLVVPYPWHRDDHQGRNATWFVERGAARLLREHELGDPRAHAQFAELLASAELREAIGQNARTLARPEAAAAIVHDLEELARGGRR